MIETCSKGTCSNENVVE